LKVRVGIISYAHVHTPGYVEQLKRREDVEIIGAYDDLRERGVHYSQKYGVTFFENLEELLRQKLDLVIITSENRKHVEHVKLAAENNINVFCEKPIGANLKEALEIKDVVRSKGILFTTGFNSRYNPEIQWVREAILKGELGNLELIRVRVAHSAALDRWFRGWSEWFALRNLSGGGALLDLGIHGADLMRFLASDEAVEAFGWIYNHTKAYEVEDNGVGLIRFSRGLMGILEASWSQALEGIRGPFLEVYGDLGSIVRTDLGLAFYSRQRRQILFQVSSGRVINALDEMIDCVKKGAQPSITAEDAVKAQEIIEAIYNSSFKGIPMSVPPGIH